MIKTCENCGRNVGLAAAKTCLMCRCNAIIHPHDTPLMWIPERISKTAYYQGIAKAVAARSTCLRRQYGAVLVKDDEIIATGYNGSPRGEANCCDVGSCWREANGVPHGQQYERCVAVHAEMNAIISAPRRDMIGSTLYLAGFQDGEPIKPEPCLICRRLIQNAGIKEVVTI